MFYTNFLRLCNSIGKTPSAVAKEIGIEKSTVTRWKQGKSQTPANMQKVADYFNVSVQYLVKEDTDPEEMMNKFSELLTRMENKKKPVLQKENELDEDLDKKRKGLIDFILTTDDKMVDIMWDLAERVKANENK